MLIVLRVSAWCPQTTADMHQIGPYSRPDALSKLDGRTREARIKRKVCADLTAHLGGMPSATQRAIIERCAVLTMQLALLDAKHAAGDMGERDTRQYLAWTNTLTKLLRHLGMKGAAERAPSLADHLAKRASVPT